MSSFTKVIPTKSQLLKLKRQIVFLKKGHSLLELKSETLLLKIKQFYRQVQEKRRNALSKVIVAFQNLKHAEVISGEHALKMLASTNKNLLDYIIEIGYRSSFGYTVPVIKYHIEHEKELPHYGFLDTNIFLDIYYQQIHESIEDLIKLAEMENTLFIMLEEYRKIRHRLNALEDIIIPQTEEQIALIEDILEETAIEEFIRLKKVKNLLTAKGNKNG